MLPIVEQHHEKWDGTGYPRGLSRTAISRTARVLAVADVFDALRSDRPYRPGFPLDRVVATIVTGAGSHFDPAIVEAFLRVTPDLDAVTAASTTGLLGTPVSQAILSGEAMIA